MSKLLDEYPILVFPSLAKELGLNESIVIQQLHYWLEKSNNFYDGRKWVYNTYDDWLAQFPFWSKATIRRTLTTLENKKIILIGNYNKLKFDNTKWYSINYEILEGVSRPSAQNEQMECSKCADGCAQNEQANTRDYTETTTDNKYYVPITKSAHATSKKYNFDDKHMELALLLKEKILINKPDFKIGNVNQWANTVRLMIERDSREYERIKEIIVWCQQDTFWHKNILSMDKLREQFDRLELDKASADKKKSWAGTYQEKEQPKPPAPEVAWAEVIEKLIRNRQKNIKWSHDAITFAVKEVGYLNIIRAKDLESIKSKFITIYRRE